MTDDQQQVDDAPEAPAGYVPESEVATLRQELSKTKRLLNKANTSRPNTDALMDDAEFVRSVFDHHGVPYDDEGRFKLPETMKDAGKIEEEYRTRLAKAQEQWRTKELSPIAEKLKALESSLNETRGTTLRQQIESSARRAGVVDDKFKPLPFGTKKNFAPVHAAQDLFSWDDEAGAHVLRDGEDVVYDSKGQPVTADTYWDFFKETAQEDVQREWFGDNRQRGSGFRNNGNARGARFTMSRAEVRKSPSQYRALKEQAKAAGQSVVITD